LPFCQDRSIFFQVGRFRDNVGVARIGVVADTHCPEFLDHLPPGVFEGLRGVDLILHAGDVDGDETLERLRTLAPVQAVRGDHDRRLRGLPRRRLVEVEGRRIGIIHGNRSRLLEEPVTLLATLTLGRVWLWLGLARWLRRQFPDADVIVYGHTHQARVEQVDGALVFNPGAVYQVTGAEVRQRLDRRPSWFEWCWLQVIRHRRDRPVPSIGLLEIGERVRITVLPLG
jgi:putative phosphoesterase